MELKNSSNVHFEKLTAIKQTVQTHITDFKMTSQILTRAELIAKGFKRNDVVRLMKKSETRVNFYMNQHIKNGNYSSPNIQQAWDAECARWDHFKATLQSWDNT